MELAELPDNVAVGATQHPEMHEAIHVNLKAMVNRVSTLEARAPEPGPPGKDGTIIGILNPGQDPPLDAAVNSLWFIADNEVVEPPVTYATPSSVGKAIAGGAGLNTTSLTLAMPVGKADGDLGFAAVTWSPESGANTLSVSSGWTLAGSLPHSGTMQTNFYTKIISASEPSLVITTGPLQQRFAASLQVIRGVSGVATVATANGATGPTMAAPSVSSPNKFVVIAGWAERASTGNSTSLATPANLTDMQATYGTGNGSVSLASARDVVTKEGGTSFSPGNWVATPGTLTGVIVWTAALTVATI